MASSSDAISLSFWVVFFFFGEDKRFELAVLCLTLRLFLGLSRTPSLGLRLFSSRDVLESLRYFGYILSLLGLVGVISTIDDVERETTEALEIEMWVGVSEVTEMASTSGSGGAFSFFIGRRSEERLDLSVDIPSWVCDCGRFCFNSAATCIGFVAVR